ncbi:MAG: VOC family protein [Acidobacteriia bacterium]|nr:VOC family protein [Terriglobia bacterium]
MPAKAGYWTSMLHVADVARSIHFYELLGFELIDTQGDGGCIGWARLHCEGGAIMLFLAEDEHPVDPRTQSQPAYMYTPDLAALRDHLLSNGVNVSRINRPPYMTSGEVRVEDPDGYVIFIGHWGDAEHTAWLAAIDEKKKTGSLRPRG